MPPPETIPVPVLLEAYGEGRFPMCHDDGELYWHDPDPRAVFPLDHLVPNARLERVIRNGRFRTTVDAAFPAVIAACADRSETWIDPHIQATYIAMHGAGHAHSVETWVGEELVGGIYGVSLKGAFFGESMFSRQSNASKVAFHALVRHLKECGHVLFDTQYLNDFTRQLGAVEIPRHTFREQLQQALALPVHFRSSAPHG